MSRIWSDRQLERATPAQAKDIRGRAFLQAVNRMLASKRLPGPDVRDPATCPVEALPALIAEYSMEEFISPGLKEEYIRALLARRYDLKRMKGYIAGIRLGLSLVGVEVDWVQWFEETPMAAPNTHRLKVVFDKPMLDGVPIGDLYHRRAAARIIEAMKRFSQSEDIEFVIRTALQGHVGAITRLSGRIHLKALGTAEQTIAATLGTGAITRLNGIYHMKGLPV
ncbi:phage tail protein I [Planktotalea sp.]|uniref:phage tail protein I n=1 Tax=Planktotalea sp. TaxID=2029877 RepID=UPI003D6BE748